MPALLTKRAAFTEQVWSSEVFLDDSLTWHTAGQRELTARIDACQTDPWMRLGRGRWGTHHVARGVEVRFTTEPPVWPNGEAHRVVAERTRRVRARDVYGLEMDSGWLVAVDAGEWGAGIWWMERSGSVSEVCCATETATRPLRIEQDVVVAVAGVRRSRLLWFEASQSGGRPSLVESVDVPGSEIAGIAPLAHNELLLVDTWGAISRFSADGQLRSIELEVDEAHPDYVPENECNRTGKARNILMLEGVETTPDHRFAIVLSNWGVLIAEASAADRWRGSWQLPVPATESEAR